MTPNIPPSAPLWRLAFRPLFLGGTLFSLIAIAWWSHFWLKPFAWTPHGGTVFWHGHEMVFGFGAAIIGGFLLTAVQSWIRVKGLRGGALAGLALIWLAGRLLMAFSSGWLVAAVDTAYLLLVTAAMAYPIIKVKQWNNLMFVPLLFTLALLNGVGHWGVISGESALAMHSLHGAILLITLIIAILGGRVVPAFTANTTGCAKARPIPWLERLAIVTILLSLALALVGFDHLPTALSVGLFGVAALANGGRFLRWGWRHSGGDPLLWSLHLAYAFIPIGFLMLALHGAGLIASASTALHAFTVGAMGGMILAMISRVTLGHTGRSLDPPGAMRFAFAFILGATLIRVGVSAWLPSLSQWGIAVAGLLWVAAYGLYLYYYAPMLLSARVDGADG